MRFRRATGAASTIAPRWMWVSATTRRCGMTKCGQLTTTLTRKSTLFVCGSRITAVLSSRSRRRPNSEVKWNGGVQLWLFSVGWSIDRLYDWLIDWLIDWSAFLWSTPFSLLSRVLRTVSSASTGPWEPTNRPLNRPRPFQPRPGASTRDLRLSRANVDRDVRFESPWLHRRLHTRTHSLHGHEAGLLLHRSGQRFELRAAPAQTVYPSDFVPAGLQAASGGVLAQHGISTVASGSVCGTDCRCAGHQCAAAPAARWHVWKRQEIDRLIDWLINFFHSIDLLTVDWLIHSLNNDVLVNRVVSLPWVRLIFSTSS